MHTVPKINWVCVLPELEKSNIASSACSSIGNKSFSLAERKKKKKRKTYSCSLFFFFIIIVFILVWKWRMGCSLPTGYTARVHFCHLGPSCTPCHTSCLHSASDCTEVSAVVAVEEEHRPVVLWQAFVQLCLNLLTHGVLCPCLAVKRGWYLRKKKHTGPPFSLTKQLIFH